MTATEVLRRLLDERGVEWKAYELNPFEKTTSWDIDTSDPAHEVCADLEEFDSGTTLLRFWNCTPEQAIAATLGSCNCSSNCTNGERTETCHEVMINRHWRGCSECGYVWENMYGEGFRIGPNYCPMCGRKVVSE